MPRGQARRRAYHRQPRTQAQLQIRRPQLHICGHCRRPRALEAARAASIGRWREAHARRVERNVASGRGGRGGGAAQQAPTCALQLHVRAAARVAARHQQALQAHGESDGRAERQRVRVCNVRKDRVAGPRVARVPVAAVAVEIGAHDQALQRGGALLVGVCKLAPRQLQAVCVRPVLVGGAAGAGGGGTKARAHVAGWARRGARCIAQRAAGERLLSRAVHARGRGAQLHAAKARRGAHVVHADAVRHEGGHERGAGVGAQHDTIHAAGLQGQAAERGVTRGRVRGHKVGEGLAAVVHKDGRQHTPVHRSQGRRHLVARRGEQLLQLGEPARFGRRRHTRERLDPRRVNVVDGAVVVARSVAVEQGARGGAPRRRLERGVLDERRRQPAACASGTSRGRRISHLQHLGSVAVTGAQLHCGVLDVVEVALGVVEVTPRKREARGGASPVGVRPRCGGGGVV